MSRINPVSGPPPPINAICPYYTMFPLDFPTKVLARADADDWVVDPFCGRGTTNLAARQLGLNTVGIDSNPVAAAIAQAKLAITSVDNVMSLAEGLISYPVTDRPSGDFWKWAFHPETLTSVCSLRAGLLAAQPSDDADFLRALILGSLHGPMPKGRPSYLSNQAPRTFAPKPRYATSYWSSRGLKPPKVEVLEVIRTRAERYLQMTLPTIKSEVRCEDSRSAASFANLENVKWFVTSPPYYGMKTYTQDQWLRLWFLGGPENVDYAHPAEQMGHASAEAFAADLKLVWEHSAAVAHPEARLIVRFGGINDRAVDPVSVLKQSLKGSGWRLSTLRSAKPVESGKRQQRQFGTKTTSPRPEVDAFCRLDE